ncbi:hypothetical protein [Calidifontibacter terrae]
MTDLPRRFEATVVAAVVAFVSFVALLGWVNKPVHRVELKQDAQTVVIGAPGLTWSDVTQSSYADLWRTLDYGALGSLNTRAAKTGTCTTDAWVSLSAGQGISLPGNACAKPPTPTVSGGAASWPQWSSWRSADRSALGSLGSAYEKRGACVQAVGPAAALAAANSTGHVAHYSATTKGARLTCPLALVDASNGSAHTTMAQLDAAFSLVPSNATVIIAGLGDGPRGGSPDLRALYVIGNSTKHGTIWSASVRQQGVVQLNDLSATAFARLGKVPSGVQGSPLQVSPNSTPSARLVGDARNLAAALRGTYAAVGWLVTGWGLLVVLAGVLLWRKRTAVPPALPPLLTLLAAVPAASFLAMWIPWERLPASGLWLVVSSLLFSALITGLAYAGAWRRHPIGPAVVVGATTWVILAVDTLRGSPLQFRAPLGLQPLNGGRYYGMGNVGFALLATGGLLAAGLGAGELIRRGERRLAAWLIGLAALATIVVDGWPGWGADFGGPPAVVIAGFVLVLLAIGIRIRPRLALLGVAIAVGVAAILALIDWSRPAASRTHLGKFVQQVIDGDGGGVIGEKLMANLRLTFGTPVSPLVVVALIALIWLVARPSSRFGAPLAAWLERVPFARETLIGLLVLWSIGYLINDSGFSIVLNGLIVAVPAALVVAGCGLRAEQDKTIRI